MTVESAAQDSRRLKTWKEIAAFFGCDERTVKRWEETRGLPVRRLPNGSRSAVFAYEHELRAWLNEDEAKANSTWSAPTLSFQRKRNRVALVAVALMVGVVALAVLLAALRPAETPATALAHRTTVDAQRFYLAGLYGWQSRTPAGLAQAVDDFTQAIVRDPQYAKAYAGLADCYNLLREYTAMPADYAFPRAKAAAERAIALDPSLADAHAALAFVDFYWSRDIRSAEREFKMALSLAPNSATVHQWYATALMDQAKFSQALSEIEKAQQIDTASSSILADKGLILFQAGRTDEALALLRQLEQTNPSFSAPHWYLALISRAQGDDGGFVHEYSLYANSRQHPADRAIASAAADGLSHSGHRGMLLSLFHAEERNFAQEADAAYLLAQTQAQLGDAAQAIRLLRSSLKRHEPDAIGLAVDPLFRSLHGIPEFRQLVREAGLEVRGS